MARGRRIRRRRRRRRRMAIAAELAVPNCLQKVMLRRTQTVHSAIATQLPELIALHRTEKVRRP
jgi:hypothetical protein